ncbi:MAG: sodium:proton exchanger, partial [Acidimicrobiia bacterium]|nr:sodium:proton exchanger [Acidimicrobiia bacterium]
MEISGVLSIAAIIFLYAVLSRFLSRRAVTAPMMFIVIGWLIGDDGLGVFDLTLETGGVRILAEATLVVVLFADATRIDIGVLRSQFRMPGRLLGIGLPLTIVVGGLVAAWLIEGISMAEGFLIGAILAPTDAALGKAVITNKSVPVRVRQLLNVESGLNDGIALPVVTALMAAAAVGFVGTSSAHWVQFAIREIGLGILVGLAVGTAGGWLMHQSWERSWITGAARQLATLAIAVIAFTTTELDVIAGNGFIAAFVAGIAFGVATNMMHETAADFTEDLGELATWMTFMFVGIDLVAPAVAAITWQRILYVVLSLTLIRM